MKLNEAIDRALLDAIPPFDKWKEIQADPRARRRYEKEQKLRRTKQKEKQLASKYAGMTAQDFENVWTRADYNETKEMFKHAQIEEKQLEDWSTEVPHYLVELLIDYLGGRELSKGNFGNRAIARMAKSRANHTETQQHARSVQQSRSNYRRKNKSLNETIDKSLLDKIPNFDDWREGGGSMAGHYRKKLEQKHSQGYVKPGLKAESYKWALEQSPEGPGNHWTEEQAEKLSNIIKNTEFTYRSHSYDSRGSYFHSYVYYKDGRHGSYQDQGY
jgi:hypothetical protein